MEKIKFNTRSEKILVTAGCSHTQGSAFLKSNYFNSKTGLRNKKGEKLYEFASYKLKKKYGKDFITSEWLSKNLTWGGKLAKLLKTDNVYNFGLGGLGIDGVCRSIYNYTKDIVSLRDHLFVIQVPSPDRQEIIANEYKVHQRPNDQLIEDKWGFTNIKHYANLYGDKFGFANDQDFKKEYYLRHYNAKFVQTESLKQLIVLQQYIESKGGHVRMFVKPFTNLIPLEISDEEEYGNLYHNFESIAFHSEEVKHLSFKEIYDTLNIINLQDLQSYRIKAKCQKQWTLHSDGTLVGDHHYNELGNQALAQCIYNNFENKELPYVYQNTEKKEGKEVLGKSLF
jgi:hypothetical protein